MSKGQSSSTYSTSEINEILGNKLGPYEMLFRGRRYGKPPLAKRCAKAIEFLKGIAPSERANFAHRVDPLLNELKGWFH